MNNIKQKYDELKKLPIYKNNGFECDMGWFEILYDLGQKITGYCEQNQISLPKIQQIKEKLGFLRFYFMFQTPVDPKHSELLRSWVREAENQSKTTCEQCGETGQLYITGGRLHVACTNHKEENSLTEEEFKEKRESLKIQQKCEECDKIGLNKITSEDGVTHYFCITHYNPNS